MLEIRDAGGFGAAPPSLWTTAQLQVELRRRQDAVPAAPSVKPECGSGSNRDVYNTPLHVFALALILGLSTLVRRFPNLKIPHYFLFLSRHFGTGVLIATAFVHLLPTAFRSLTDPCLPYFWNEGYQPMPGLVAMTSCLVVVGIEMFFSLRGAGHVHESEFTTVPMEEGGYKDVRNGHLLKNGVGGRGGGGGDRRGKRRHEQLPRNDAALGAIAGSSEQLVWGKKAVSPLGSPKAQRAPRYVDHDEEEDDDDDADSFAKDSDLDLDLDELDPTTDSADLLRSSHSHRPTRLHTHHQNLPLGPLSPTSEAHAQQKLLLQCLLLEAGILFHSIFIGLALSVSTGTPFLVLLIAISFHQTFEGLALGSRIAAIPSLKPSSLKPWLMALAYGLTTPIGQAIGLGVHGLYDPYGQTGLITVGITNAISSGLLLFAGLVQLLSEDFLSEHSYKSLRGRRRKEACGAVVVGAALMALVGAWA
ncbi:MAG: hypothetical protein MMC33_005725 [Icmadophila ericetorum]|nr:hypothetical protein [Icmadophila ericetorum]